MLDLGKFPRPNFEEMPDFYDELDDLAGRVEKAIRKLSPKLFDEGKEIIRFSKMVEDDLRALIKADPDALVPAFTKVCGLSVRQFERLYGLKNVYKLRRLEDWSRPTEENDKFVRAVLEQLGALNLALETFIYTFYKAWEVDRKRFVRGKRAEEEVQKFLKKRGYDCGKVTKPVEVDVAIPPSQDDAIKILVAIPVRTGVRRDLVKRAKEFSEEYDTFTRAFRSARVLVIFRIPKHELHLKGEIREKIAEQRGRKKAI